jgi:UPF0755 protein
MKFHHYNGVRRERRRWPYVLIVLALLSGGGFAIASYSVQHWYIENVKAYSNDETKQIFTVETGATPQSIGDNLQSKHLIKSSKAFTWYIRTHDVRDQLKAGTYRLSPSMQVADIVNIMVDGKVATDLFTILPGQRLDQIKDAMVKAGFDATEVTQALEPSVYAGHPALTDKPKAASLEGYLYPESFAKTKDTSPETIIRASLDEMQKRLTPDVRAGFARQGLTVHEGITLASIITQEVPKPEDKAIVAQIFLKRLKNNIPLESDVTVFYAAKILGLPATLTIDSPYNTYKYTGLPPGPLSNTTDTSLQAVIQPAATDYLYFVAGDDGVTHFSKTLAEHQALTRQYCKQLCQ